MKNLAKISFVSAFSLFILTGCSPKTPDCSSGETKDLALQIVNDELKSKLAPKRLQI